MGMLIERRKDLRGKSRLESALTWARVAFGAVVKDQTIFVVPNELKVGIQTKWIIEKGVFSKDDIMAMRTLIDQGRTNTSE